ncbi:M48 family metalloprotease [Sphaerotilaceae bacterium SBD11-9]
MRWLLLIWLALAGGVARGEDIAEVLARSQQVRLDALPPAPASPQAHKVRASFEALVHVLGLAGRGVELRVVRGETVAETLNGHVVVANESLGDWPEADRLFVLAHELGHVALDHWSQVSVMYQKWVPGTVTRQQTDSVAALLGREASQLAYQHEYEADAFASRTLEGLGISQQEVFSVFMHLGSHKDTPTHPGTQRRLAALRAAEIPLPAAR